MAALAALVAWAPASAQGPARPFRQWRTLETPHFSFHYPREFEAWTRDVAAHMEGVDSAVAQLVGYQPRERIQVVVDDPFNEPNGSALPFLRAPVLNFWPVPPSPREQIGDWRTWGEMLSVHEFAHLAHLMRPSRNPLDALFWELAPAELGPIPVKAPRWVVEGYATYVEGRITGSGRPNGVWRSAILRQWAIEGHLPTYDQMSGWSAFEGGSFAYLAGSAFLEWLTADAGDSSLVHLWRRTTAREDRSFDDAFAGVFGDSPRVKYGQFTAALTADALAAARSTDGVAGTMVQHLGWATGDPAFSRDGKRVALVLRAASAPARTVIWTTEPARPDTVQARRVREMLARDPEDVAPIEAYPPPRKPVATLEATAGRAYENPHFLSDGRVLVDRSTRQSEGDFRPDLYIWTPATGSVRRLTFDAGVADADPSPDGAAALGTRCEGGHCDVVTVTLATGAVTTVLRGSPARSYYRPRYAPDGRRFVVSASGGGAWQLLLARVDGARVEELLDDERGSRYDAEFTPTGDSLIFVSDESGIPNLAGLVIGTDHTFSLTNVSGAAVAPAIDPATGAVWFLNLHARGFDVRALEPPLPRRGASSVRGGFGGAAPPVPHPRPPMPANPVGGPLPYDLGARHSRYLPGESLGPDGAAGSLFLTNTDVIGRLNALAGGSWGARPQWNGGTAAVAWRGTQVELDAGAHWARRLPSRGSVSDGAGDDLDATRRGGVLAAAYTRYGDLWRWRVRAGGAVERLSLSEAAWPLNRTVAFVEWDGGTEQSRGKHAVTERLAVHLDGGRTGVDDIRRVVVRASIGTTGFTPVPLVAAFTVGHAAGSTLAFERFAAGGLPSPLVDSSLTAARLAIPALPNGAIRPSVAGSASSLFDGRLSAPMGLVTPYYEAVAVTDGSKTPHWHRVAGLEARFATDAIPTAYLPGFSIAVGVARSFDAPFVRSTLYSQMRITP